MKTFLINKVAKLSKLFHTPSIQNNPILTAENYGIKESFEYFKKWKNQFYLRMLMK